MNLFNSTIYKIMEWITRFAYVNVLWIGFTLLGLIIFGFFPSTVAMFAVMRDWLQGKTDLPVFTTFWTYIKKEFFKSHLLGLFVLAIGLLIAADLYFIKMTLTESFTIIHIPLFAFMLLFVFFLFYLFPAFVHYDLRILPLIKNAFFIMLVSPFHSVMIVICLVSLAFIMKLLPALAFIFGGSSFAFIIMWLALHSFRRIQKKQQGST